MNNQELNDVSSKFEVADFAIWLCFAGATFALLASFYVWIMRGNTAFATIGAAIWALVTALQYYLKRRQGRANGSKKSHSVCSKQN